MRTEKPSLSVADLEERLDLKVPEQVPEDPEMLKARLQAAESEIERLRANLDASFAQELKHGVAVASVSQAQNVLSKTAGVVGDLRILRRVDPYGAVEMPVRLVLGFTLDGSRVIYVEC